MCGYIFFVLVILALGSEVQTTCYSGTTPRLKDIVLGRCWSYQQLKGLTAINCTTLWKAFYDGFAFKDPCDVKMSDYEAFFAVGDRQEVFNKGLFWSGTYKAVHDYSAIDLIFQTLEDTLEGSMLNNLCWCGKPSDGIDYKSCPKCKSGRINSIKAFWDLASKTFAERVRGVARVMVNGSRGALPAYNKSSVFGQMELPYLNVSTVDKLKILVVHTIEGKTKEKCNDGSIKELQDDAKKRHISVDCVDDQNDVKHILCGDYLAADAKRDAKECRFLDNYKPDYRPWEISVIVLASLLFIATLALVVLLSILCRKKRQADQDPLPQA